MHHFSGLASITPVLLLLLLHTVHLSWCSSASSAYSKFGPVGDLEITDAYVQPDGFRRQAVLANGVYPGPLITGKKGDHFKINVKDKLTNDTMLTDTTISWHGIFQKNTNWADGVASVTQCPIVSGHDFLYDFNVRDQAGTFWYHSQVPIQYCDGLRGPMVVYDDYDPHAGLYDVDDESTVITLSDWYHDALDPTPGSRAPKADSILINGLGRFVGGGTSPLAVISVEYGKRYRFRLIALSCQPNFIFSIDNHLLTIIEADGENVEPLVVDSIQIFPAQRYSFVLHAQQKVDNYWIRALSNDGPVGFDGGVNSAILRYVGAPEVDPTTTTALTDPEHPLVETDLHALDHPGAPGKPEVGGADVAINFNISLNAEVVRFLVNGVSFDPPTVPVLLQILNGAKDAVDLLPMGSIYPLPRNKSVELSFNGPGLSSGPHAIHLHGHSFDVVRSANSSTYNFANPVRRDVVSLGHVGDNVTIRFTTDNPGPWLLQCHIDPHYNDGLALVMAEDVEDTAAENPVPPAWNDLCKIYNAENAQ